MLEEVLSLTEKEREKIFTKKVAKGAYVDLGSSTPVIYKIIEYNREAKVCLITQNNKRFTVRAPRDLMDMVLTRERFEKIRQWNTEHNAFPSTHESAERILKRILLSVYGEERFDIQNERDTAFRVIVHYPEIVITNSMEMSHTIRDLFFQFNIYFREDNKIQIKNFRLARTTVEENEWLGGTDFYIFSHVKYFYCPWEMSNRQFCFGMDTPLRKLASQAVDGIKLTQLRQFLYIVNSYFQWESLEGVPYHKLIEIGSKRYSRIEGHTISAEIINSWVEEVIKAANEFTFNFEEQGVATISTINNVEVNKFIEDIINTNNPPQVAMCCIVNGVPVTAKEGRLFNFSDFAGIKTDFSFRGKKIPFKIIPSEEVAHEKFINPNIIQDVKKNINEKFQMYLLLNYEK